MRRAARLASALALLAVAPALLGVAKRPAAPKPARVAPGADLPPILPLEGPSGASSGPRLLPWGGATPPQPVVPYKGPYQATLACAEGVKNFPFLKPWVAKLDNFVAPIEIGSTEGSLFYALGVTTVGRRAVELWRKDAFQAPVEWKEKGGSVESAWLGPLPGGGPNITPGPGYATVHQGSGRTQDASQMGARRSAEIDVRDAAIQGYTQDAIHDAGKIGTWARFWSLLFAPSELDMLKDCEKDRCKIKFDDPELKRVTGASHQYRLAHFRKIIEDRIEDYRERGRVWAYEGTYKPMDWVDLPIGPEFPWKYETHFWMPPERSNFGYEVLDAEPGHHKPVVGLFSRQCEKRGSGAQSYTACTDIVVYNNHYFDYWARLVFLFPWCDVQVALAYETMDIDQIKESRVVRILFGGEMRKLMGMLLETRLKHLHMLGF